MRDYQLVSPSLDGILRHDSVVYEGARFPEELLRIMDRAGATGAFVLGQNGSKDREYTKEECQIITGYFGDIHAVFMKKLSSFVAGSGADPEDSVKLRALLQEMVRVKEIIRDLPLRGR